MSMDVISTVLVLSAYVDIFGMVFSHRVHSNKWEHVSGSFMLILQVYFVSSNVITAAMVLAVKFKHSLAIS